MEQGLRSVLFDGIATESDLHMIEKVWSRQKHSFPNAVSSDFTFSRSDTFVCIYQKDKLIAFARVKLDADTMADIDDNLFIDILCVGSGFENKGVGAYLMKAIEKLNVSYFGNKDLLISTWYGNNRIVRLIEKFGYELQSTYTYLLVKQSLKFYTKKGKTA